MVPSRQSSLLIAVPEVEDLVADWRRDYDPGVALNIQCHVTILYPFAPADLVDDALVERLRDLVDGFGTLDFELTRLSEFPGVLWLKPEPDDDLIRLMTVMRTNFPEYPPYEGEHMDTVPHLTVAMTEDSQQHESLKQRIADDLAPSLPVRCTASHLELHTSDDAGLWSLHSSLSLE